MEKVIIFGEGGLQELAHFYLQRDEKYEVVAFTADAEYIEHNSYLGLPLIPFEEIKTYYPPDKYKMFVPLGYRKNNHIRAGKYFAAKEKGYSFISYISPDSVCYANSVGENCFIFEGAIIQPFTSIGNDTILTNGSTISHHSKVGNHGFVAPKAVICGLSEIGDYTFIGAGATVAQGRCIADHNIIGMGAAILSDTKTHEVYKTQVGELLPVDSDEIYIDKHCRWAKKENK